jgi:hypothetical protein
MAAICIATETQTTYQIQCLSASLITVSNEDNGFAGEDV